MRIYIADDNPGFATFCKRVAVNEGWTVSVSENGRELLTALKEEKGPALLLVDIQMPELDGIEVINKLVSHAGHFRVRFITGGPPSTAIAAHKIAEINDLSVGTFLVKPITIQDLTAMLQEETEKLRGLRAA